MNKNNLKLTNTKNYQTFLSEIKKQIKTSQARAIGAVKSEMTILYFKCRKSHYTKAKRGRLGYYGY